jgi:hypothetical protein
MKKLITICSILIMSLMLKVNELQKPVIPATIVRSQPTEVEQFMHRMALRESDNTVHATNRFGMLGKYQFHPSTIKMLGYRVSNKKFLNDSKLQDSVMLANMRLNNKELKFIINRYEGKVVKEIKITRAGILAAAHLAGPVHVAEFFNNNNDKTGRQDANGTSVREYLKIFSRYNIKPEHLL